MVMDMEQYTELAYKHLNDPDTYDKLTIDPTESIAKKFVKYLAHLRDVGIVESATHRFLLPPPSKVKTQHIYFLPKLHNTRLKVCPIVAGCGGLTETASAYIDKFVQPIIQLGKFFVANSTQFINTIETTRMPKYSLLVTLDVASLYTNISHEDALEAVSKVFEMYNLPHLPPIDVLLDILSGYY